MSYLSDDWQIANDISVSLWLDMHIFHWWHHNRANRERVFDQPVSCPVYKRQIIMQYFILIHSFRSICLLSDVGRKPTTHTPLIRIKRQIWQYLFPMWVDIIYILHFLPPIQLPQQNQRQSIFCGRVFGCFFSSHHFIPVTCIFFSLLLLMITR